MVLGRYLIVGNLDPSGKCCICPAFCPESKDAATGLLACNSCCDSSGRIVPQPSFLVRSRYKNPLQDPQAT